MDPITLGILALALGAVSFGYSVYKSETGSAEASRSSNTYGGGGYNFGGPAPSANLTPEEKAFYQQQALLAESAAATQAESALVEANAAYTQALTTGSFWRVFMMGAGILAIWYLVRKKKLL